jgi:hypothetical protein
MGQPARLLWIRSAIPGPDYLGVVDHLAGSSMQVVKNPSEALDRLRGEIADIILVEFPLAGWHPPNSSKPFKRSIPASRF